MESVGGHGTAPTTSSLVAATGQSSAERIRVSRPLPGLATWSRSSGTPIRWLVNPSQAPATWKHLPA